MIHDVSTSESITVRGLRYHIRHWGSETAPKLFFLHGWMDSSPTFQFVVESLKESWHVIAPDWRGYGQSEWLGRPYWFPDYYADLEVILDRYSPDEPAWLVGHSMGANIASIYAGVRPERVKQLALLDFLGLKPIVSETSVSILSRWLCAISSPPLSRRYPDHEALAKRLMGANPRLSPHRAEFLAKSVSCSSADGQIQMACDPWHKVPSPRFDRVEDSMSVWREITAPVLMLIADQGLVAQRFNDSPEDFAMRTSCFRDLTVREIVDSGHNIQHDQPEQTARHLEEFFLR